MSHNSSIHTSNSFWKAVNILLTKPHVINKRLWGGKILFRKSFRVVQWEPPRLFPKLKTVENVQEDVTNNIAGCFNEQGEGDIPIEVIVTELLPKNYAHDQAIQLTILLQGNVEAIFYDITPDIIKQNLSPQFNYSLKLEAGQIKLKTDIVSEEKSYQWLTNTVLPQFTKWSLESTTAITTKNRICNGSLELVSSDEYYEKYNHLKIKYGKEMVKIWPECTDPSKFVYEDVAIATYLLLLWEEDRKKSNKQKMQTFVDLGCGNGLLVYILTKESHHGVGIDIRRRQIWDTYTNDIILEEKTVTPSDESLFPETDWIIGNHSDELTPWIPVIAARSSYKCKFFLLPCCAYNFDGTKYQRQNSSKSQYIEYLEYIKQLCEECGFQTDTDRLKIPSTKRICLVGRFRTYPQEDFELYSDKIHVIINGNNSKTEEINQNWHKDFKPRDPVERVKNCTQIDKSITASIIKSITNYLLSECEQTSRWSIGKTVCFNEIVKIIPPETLKVLKSECGGLQTLLKNHHHIFKVQSGQVRLRHPRTVEEANSDISKRKNIKLVNLKIQQKPCWFFSNHPQGCPLSNTSCSFMHVMS